MKMVEGFTVYVDIVHPLCYFIDGVVFDDGVME